MDYHLALGCQEDLNFKVIFGHRMNFPIYKTLVIKNLRAVKKLKVFAIGLEYEFQD